MFLFCWYIASCRNIALKRLSQSNFKNVSVFMFYTPFFDVTWSFFEVWCLIFHTKSTENTDKNALRGVRVCEKLMWIITIILSTNYFFLNTNWPDFIFSFFHFSAAQLFGSPVKPCVWIWINPINPMNLLNHREAVCFFKTSSCGTIERIQLIFLTTD